MAVWLYCYNCLMVILFNGYIAILFNGYMLKPTIQQYQQYNNINNTTISTIQQYQQYSNINNIAISTI
jgi:hypothetical protein